MTLPQVHLDRIAPQAWANGGGATRELLIWPAGAQDWSLRVSVAEIDRDGAFSALPGFERWFVVIGGPGVVLALPQGRRILERGSPPLSFDGADAPHCEMLGDPSTDLNLMIRQTDGTGTMQAAVPEDEWISRARWRALYAADATTLQVDDTDIGTLRAGTLVYSQHADRQRWRVRPVDPLATRAWWMAFTPHAEALR